MTFSIVQTIEHGKYLLSTVPHKWVQNDTLYWPTNKSTLIKLRRNQNSVPDNSWTTFPCIVKKTGLKTYEEAVKLERDMLEWSVSESEPQIPEKAETYTIKNRMKRVLQTDTSLALSQITNFDNMFEMNNIADSQIPGTRVLLIQQPEKPAVPEFSNHLVRPVENIALEFNNNEPTNDLEFEDGNMVISCDITNLNQDLCDFSNFEQRLAKLEASNCEMNAKLDKILEILQHQNKNQNNSVAAPDILTSFPFPLSKVDQVDMLESKLLEENFKKNLINELKRMNGTSGNLDGKKVSYKLVDWLFDRKLLKEYSWTGSSKNKNKHAFLALKQIVDMIYQIVTSADCRFNMHMVEQFLKVNILKYSESRSHQLENQARDERQCIPKAIENTVQNIPVNIECKSQVNFNKESNLREDAPPTHIEN